MSRPNSILTASELILTGSAYPDFSELNLLSRVSIGFDNFLQEDHSYKELWGVDLDNFDKTIGYEARGRQDRDIEIFNEKAGLRKLVVSNGLRDDKYENWLMDLKHLRHNCLNYCLLLAEGLCFSLEKDFFALEKAIKLANKDHVLRLAKYPSSKTDSLIETQEDAGFISLHLFDNFSGFYFGKNYNVEYIKQENKVLAFFGKKAQIFSDQLIAMPHAVKNNLPAGRSIALSFILDVAL